MTTRSVSQNTARAQALANETAVEQLVRLLPRRLGAADRGAMHGLSYAQPKGSALRLSEINVNDHERILAIVIDVDRTDADVAWMDADCVPPNFITISPRKHAHYVYLLADSIWLQRDTARTVRYADAIQRALSRAVGGQISYAWRANSTHNPLSGRYRTREIHSRPYRLAELAIGLDLADGRRRFHDVGCEDGPLVMGERNDGLFRRALRLAGRVMQRSKSSAEYETAMTQLGQTVNEQCIPPLDSQEVDTIIRSVIKYRPFRRRDRAAECKAARAKEGRTWAARVQAAQQRQAEARQMRAEGMTIAAIAAELRVATRTVDRYLAGLGNARKERSSRSPIQGNAGDAASSRAIWLGEPRAISDVAKSQNGGTVHIDAVEVWIEPTCEVVDGFYQHAGGNKASTCAGFGDKITRITDEPTMQHAITPSPPPIGHSRRSKYAAVSVLMRPGESRVPSTIARGSGREGRARVVALYADVPFMQGAGNGPAP